MQADWIPLNLLGIIIGNSGREAFRIQGSLALTEGNRSESLPLKCNACNKLARIDELLMLPLGRKKSVNSLRGKTSKTLSVTLLM